MSISVLGATQINDLPVSNNITSQILPQQQQQQQQQNNQSMKDLVSNNIKNEISSTYTPNVNNEPTNNNSTNYNELIGQIQHADKMGATKLPSRDIPQNQNNIIMDENIKPNFIPNETAEIMPDYIANYETANDILDKYDMDEENREKMDQIYKELQTPVLLAGLYFLFNLPTIRKHLHRIIPKLFSPDGNPNLYGYTFNSITFAGLFYLINKIINSLSTYYIQ